MPAATARDPNRYGRSPLLTPMREHRLCATLSLIRQGLTLEVEFGTRPLEALLWIAETIEESVYVPGSLARTPTGVRFALANPPLRVGAFGAVRLLLNGTNVPADRLRLRTGLAAPWRTAASVSRDAPLELAPGVPTEVAAETPPPAKGPATVRLELESVAIPPLVWLEFSDEVRDGGPP